MKKFANPFDSFTAEHSPDDFAVCAWKAAEWLLPYMDNNNTTLRCTVNSGHACLKPPAAVR